MQKVKVWRNQGIHSGFHDDGTLLGFSTKTTTRSDGTVVTEPVALVTTGGEGVVRIVPVSKVKLVDRWYDED